MRAFQRTSSHDRTTDQTFFIDKSFNPPPFSPQFGRRFFNLQKNDATKILTVEIPNCQIKKKRHKSVFIETLKSRNAGIGNHLFTYAFEKFYLVFGATFFQYVDKKNNSVRWEFNCKSYYVIHHYSRCSKDDSKVTKTSS